MSVVVLARYFPKPGQAQALLDVFAPFAEAFQAEDGCELYAFHESKDGSIVLIEKWASREQLDAHLATELIPRLRAAREPLLDRPHIIEPLAPRPIGDPAKAAL